MPPLPQSLLVKPAFRKDVLLVKEDKVREYLSKLDACESTGPDGMHPLKLMEVAEVIASQH